MLVLEATSEQQGDRPDDYHWCEDGELAYKPGIECSCPDCGCERGWAGLDSRQATTTVRVVDRPDLTIEQLASKLAASLNNEGWIDTPDPADELVACFVDDIVQIASHFGEGAVLERDGEWTRLRDGSSEPINPFDRVRLEQMTDGLVDDPPMAVLSRATSILNSVSPFVEPLVDTLADADWPNAQILGCALEWLSTGTLGHDWNSLPEWLQHLDAAEATDARRKLGNDGDAYLVAISVRGVEIGTASFYVMHAGNIDSFFAIPDSISSYTQLMKTVQRQHYKPFRKIAVATARSAAEQGRDNLYQHNAMAHGVEERVGVAWPNNLPLFDFVIDQVQW